MGRYRIAASVSAALLVSIMTFAGASAMPVDELTTAKAQAVHGIQQARWVCGPYRCWWGWHRRW